MATTKRTWETVIDQMYASVFSDLNKKRFEKITLYLSIIGFITLDINLREKTRAD